MRFSVTVDPALLGLAQKVSGAPTKQAAIERALQALIQAYRRAEAIRHAGAFPLTITRRTLRRLRRRD
jgi:hypothetical protein